MLGFYLLTVAMASEPTGRPMVFARPYFNKGAYAMGGSGIMGRCKLCGENTLTDYVVTAQCEPRSEDAWQALCNLCAPPSAVDRSSHPHHLLMLRWAGYRFGLGGPVQEMGGPGDPAVVTRSRPPVWAVPSSPKPRKGSLTRAEGAEALLLAERVLEGLEPHAGALAASGAEWVASGVPGWVLREVAHGHRQRELTKPGWLKIFRRRPTEWRRGVLFVCAVLDAVDESGAPFPIDRNPFVAERARRQSEQLEEGMAAWRRRNG